MKKLQLKFIWLEKSIAVALDEKIGEKSNPITKYFVWPETDAWEDLKAEIEKKSWIPANEGALILNQATEVITHWQNKEQENFMGLQKIKEIFKECEFIGRN
jgi:30S ribosomal protein 3